MASPAQSSTDLPGVFLASLVSSIGHTQSIAAATKANNSFRIVADNARGLKLSSSLTFHKVKRQAMIRRRARGIDPKKISRWDSHPRIRKNTDAPPKIPILPPRPTKPYIPRIDCLMARCKPVQKASAKKKRMTIDASQEEIGNTSFTPSNVWLNRVATTAGYSPNDVPRSLRKKHCRVHSLDNPRAQQTTEDCALPMRMQNLSFDKSSLCTSAHAPLVPSPQDLRAAALSGAPQRPQRRSSFCAPGANLDAAEVVGAIEASRLTRHSGPANHALRGDRRRDHRQSTDGGQEQQDEAKDVDSDFKTELVFEKDISTSEWTEIGARTA